MAENATTFLGELRALHRRVNMQRKKENEQQERHANKMAQRSALLTIHAKHALKVT
jgi:hypothetical protein